MADRSPFHYFSRLAEDRVSTRINEIIQRELDIPTVTLEADSELTINGNTAGESSFDLGNIVGATALYGYDGDFDWYGGCSKCYQFSMLFGGSPSNIGVITNDEDFEKYKMQFVEHYNEKHRDLYEWRKKKIGKKPITSEKNIERLQNRISLNPSNITYSFDGNDTTLNISTGTTLFFSGDEVGTIALVPPPITAEDKIIIDKVEKKGEIKNDDLKRINKKYGKSIINNAMKTYRANLPARRGWRD